MWTAKTDQTGRMLRLIGVFADPQVILLVCRAQLNFYIKLTLRSSFMISCSDSYSSLSNGRPVIFSGPLGISTTVNLNWATYSPVTYDCISNNLLDLKSCNDTMFVCVHFYNLKKIISGRKGTFQLNTCLLFNVVAERIRSPCN